MLSSRARVQKVIVDTDVFYFFYQALSYIYWGQSWIVHAWKEAHPAGGDTALKEGRVICRSCGGTNQFFPLRRV